MEAATAFFMFDLAVKGNDLIRGWGATLWLSSVVHTPSIHMCAPMSLRVKRLMARLETVDKNLARKEIRGDEAARSARMAAHFDVEWGDPALYDLSLNTERIPVSSCVDMVVSLAKSPAFAETVESRQHLVNLALAARVRAALRAHADTAHVDVDIVAQNGTVTLSGIVSNSREYDHCADVTSVVVDVKNVVNQLRTMTGGIGGRIFPGGLAR